MKKKILLSTVTAAAIIFSGTAFNKAEAANVQCNPTILSRRCTKTNETILLNIILHFQLNGRQ